jgi:hypothetical protein
MAGKLWFPVGIEVIFPCIVWVIVPRIKVLDNARVGKICRPPTPVADLMKWPALFTSQPLTSTASKAVTTIHGHVENTYIKEIISEPLKKSPGSLFKVYECISGINKEILQLVHLEVQVPDPQLQGLEIYIRIDNRMLGSILQGRGRGRGPHLP